VVRQGRVVEVATSLGPRSAGVVVVASGAWSGALLARAGVEVRLRPIRGQMVLLSTRAGLLRHIVNDGHRYLVPRCDGRLLVGSTEEDVGFDKQTTGAGIGRLLELAIGLVPALGDARFEACWAGLRPATIDRLPLLGRLPEVENCLVATGHFRSGLHLSPITAVLLAEQVRGTTPSFDLSPFSPDRFAATAR
jgi:glycine oxidase